MTMPPQQQAMAIDRTPVMSEPPEHHPEEQSYHAPESSSFASSAPPAEFVVTQDETASAVASSIRSLEPVWRAQALARIVAAGKLDDGELVDGGIIHEEKLPTYKTADENALHEDDEVRYEEDVRYEEEDNGQTGGAEEPPVAVPSRPEGEIPRYPQAAPPPRPASSAASTMRGKGYIVDDSAPPRIEESTVASTLVGQRFLEVEEDFCEEDEEGFDSSPGRGNAPPGETEFVLDAGADLELPPELPVPSPPKGGEGGGEEDEPAASQKEALMASVPRKGGDTMATALDDTSSEPEAVTPIPPSVSDTSKWVNAAFPAEDELDGGDERRDHWEKSSVGGGVNNRESDMPGSDSGEATASAAPQDMHEKENGKTKPTANDEGESALVAEFMQVKLDLANALAEADAKELEHLQTVALLKQKATELDMALEENEKLKGLSTDEQERATVLGHLRDEAERSSVDRGKLLERNVALLAERLSDQNRLRKLNAELDKLKSEHAKMENGKERLESQLASAETECGNLRAALAQAVRERDTLRGDVGKLERANYHLDHRGNPKPVGVFGSALACFGGGNGLGWGRALSSDEQPVVAKRGSKTRHIEHLS